MLSASSPNSLAEPKIYTDPHRTHRPSLTDCGNPTPRNAPLLGAFNDAWNVGTHGAHGIHGSQRSQEQKTLGNQSKSGTKQRTSRTKPGTASNPKVCCHSRKHVSSGTSAKIRARIGKDH